MTPKQLRSALRKLGLSQLEAARRLRMDPSGLRRNLSGKTPIRGATEAAVKAWLALHRAGLEIPE